MRTSGVLAFVLVVALVAAAMILGGGAFLNIPAMVICPGLPILLGVLSFGPKALWTGLSSVWLLFAKEGPQGPRGLRATVLRGLIVHAYAAAALGVLIGLIQILRGLDPGPDFAGKMMTGAATLLICPFYAVLLAELLFRPALHLVTLRNET